MRTNIRNEAADAGAARVFFALWPAPAVGRALHDCALKAQQTAGGRCTAPESLHLTLLFLGDVPRAQIGPLQQAIDGHACPAFSFALQQIACWRHNRIAFAAPEGDPAALYRLAETLRQLTERAGIAYDHRPFTPHVTLLRKVQRPFPPHGIPPQEWRVTEFSLVESCKSAEGVRYCRLKSWPCTR